MHRRGLLKLAATLLAVGGALTLPGIAQAADEGPRKILISELQRPMRECLRKLGFESLFEEQEFRAYTEMSVSWVACQFTDPDEYLKVEFHEDYIETSFSGEIHEAWRKAVELGMLRHALFAYDVNHYDREGNFHGLPVLTADLKQVPPPNYKAFKAERDRVEEQHDIAIDWYQDAVERQYDIYEG